MKTRFLVRASSVLVVTTVAFSTAAAHAGMKADALAKKYRPLLLATSAVELPAKATVLVIKADPADRSEAAIAVVRVVSEINPAASAAVVGAIARAEPNAAPTIAAEASALDGKGKKKGHYKKPKDKDDDDGRKKDD